MRRQMNGARASAPPQIDEYDAKVVDICLGRTALNETAGRMSRTAIVVLVHEIGGIEISSACDLYRQGNIVRDVLGKALSSIAIAM